MPLREAEGDLIGSETKARRPRSAAETFRGIYREIGASVKGRISVERIQDDFSSIVKCAKDPDTLRDVNLALNSCFSVVAPLQV